MFNPISSLKTPEDLNKIILLSELSDVFCLIELENRNGRYRGKLHDPWLHYINKNLELNAFIIVVLKTSHFDQSKMTFYCWNAEQTTNHATFNTMREAIHGTNLLILLWKASNLLLWFIIRNAHSHFTFQLYQLSPKNVHLG